MTVKCAVQLRFRCFQRRGEAHMCVCAANGVQSNGCGNATHNNEEKETVTGAG